ncbi:uncharacterized protein [Palaemon carinicauda]|uniref:uncharacterized protein n=1 Tax=Palaemon carinicauda TaxID=392227 RepID=UPI0035B63BF6
MAVEKRLRKKIKKLREALKKIGKCDDKPFKEQELQETLRSGKSTAPGLDGITYNAIRFLTTIESVVSTLKVYNQDGKKMELGTPQGGVLSPTLFNTEMNILRKINITGIIIIIYADHIVVQASTDKRIKRAIRACTSLCNSIGLVISPEKTKMIARGTRNPLILHIQGQRKEKVAQYKCMGVILSNRCHKLYEVKRIVQASAVRLRLLWKVARGSVGASVPMVKLLYTSMIRSIIDYSSSMLMPLRKSYIGILEIIQNKAARSILGAPKSVRQEILRNEACLKPINHRLAITAIIQLYRSIMTDHDGLTRDTLIHSYPKRLKNGWVTAARQLIEASSMKEYLDITKIDVKSISPWSIPETEILLSTLKGKKEEMNPALLKNDYFQRLDIIQAERVHYYTDGSLLEDGRAGSGVTVYQNGAEVHSLSLRSSDGCSVLQSKLLGVTAALSIIKRNKDNAIIATDSLSALQSLIPRKAESNTIVRRPIDLLSQIKQAGRMVAFIWVPSHTGIRGNERADELTKEGARKERVDYKLTPSLNLLKDSVGMEIMNSYNEKIE